MPQSILDKLDNSRSGWEEVPKVDPLCDGMNIEKGHADIGDAKLYYEREGKDGNVPIVLVPGGPGNSHQGFHPAFSKAAEFAQVIYYDPRGTGESTKEPGKSGSFSIGQAVEDLEKLRQKLGYEKWCVLGHSYGGTVARLYAEKYPQHTLGIVLNCASYYGLPIEAESSRERMLSHLTDGEKERREEINAAKDKVDPATGNIMDHAKWVYNRFINGDWKRQNFFETSKDDAARIATENAKVSQKFFNDMGNSIHELIHSKLAPNRLPDMKVLILEGKDDVTWAEGKAKKLGSCFDNPELHEFENSSHCPQDDVPGSYFDVLKNYVLPLKNDYDKSLNKSRDERLSPPSSSQDEGSQTRKEAGVFRGRGGEKGGKNYKSVLSNQAPTTVGKTAETKGNKVSSGQIATRVSISKGGFNFKP